MHFRFVRCFRCVAVPVLTAVSALAQSTVSETARYAYGANLGWVDARPTSDNGLRLTDNVLSGWLYSANTGWIHLGDGTPANGIGYANDSATDYGVNVSASGALTGNAWSPNLGWITFEFAQGKALVARSTGAFVGYAWSANAGWISLGGFPNAIVSTTWAEGLDSDVDGLPDYRELQLHGSLATTSGDADSNGDGTTNRQEYLASRGPFAFGGFTWQGGFPGAQTDMRVIQNWSPSIPPATFVAFNGGDTLNVNVADASASLPGGAFTLRELRVDSAGGQVDLINASIDTAQGFNLVRGEVNLSGFVEVFGPVRTTSGATMDADAGQANFSRGEVTNRGTWNQRGLLYATRFENDGIFRMPNLAAYSTFTGHFVGEPESVLEIDGAQVPPGGDGHGAGAFNLWTGSLAWVDGGDFDIGERSWTFFALTPGSPGSAFELENTHRFQLGDVDWTLASGAFFQVGSGSPQVYGGVEPQVTLENLTITNAGTLRFVVDEIALNDLAVTGNPVEIMGQNGRTTRIRELSQSTGMAGTLRADVFGGLFALETASLVNAIDLTLGRSGAETTVKLGDFTNAATLRIGGLATLITPPAGDEPEAPPRTLTNTGTLAIGAGTTVVEATLANSASLSVAAGAEARVRRLAAQTGTLTVAAGGVLVSGPAAVPDLVTVDTPREPLTLAPGATYATPGQLTLRLHDIAFTGGAFSGELIRLEAGMLRLNYELAAAAPSRFSFSGLNFVSGPGTVQLIPAGSLWRVETFGTLQFSSLLNAGTLQIGTGNAHSAPYAFVRPTGELINTGLVHTAARGGYLEGRFINQGQVNIVADSQLIIAKNTDSPQSARLANYADFTIAAGGAVRLYTSTAADTFEQLGGTLNNLGTLEVNYPSRFIFGGGRIVGQPVTLVNGTLEIASAAGAGEFVLRGAANTLATPNGLTPPLVTLRLEGAEDGGTAALTTPGFLHRGTLLFTSTAADLSVGRGARLTLTGDAAFENEGTVRFGVSPGLNAHRVVEGRLENRGLVQIDPGADVRFPVEGTGFDNAGVLELGAGATLTFEQASQTFGSTTAGTVRGSGRITQAGGAWTLAGSVEPQTVLTLDANVALTGRLHSRFRNPGAPLADRLAVNGALQLSGSRLVVGPAPGVVVPVGVRHVVASASSLSGVVPVAHVTPELAWSHSAAVSVVGNTLGVTFTAGSDFQNWAHAFDVPPAAPSADSDGDGVPSLLEYAFGLDPSRQNALPLGVSSQRLPASSGMMTRSGAAGASTAVDVLSLSFPWHTGVRDYTWRMETSPSLAADSWVTAGSVNTVIEPTSDPDRVMVTLTVAIAGPRTFARIAVIPGVPPLD